MRPGCRARTPGRACRNGRATRPSALLLVRIRRARRIAEFGLTIEPACGGTVLRRCPPETCRVALSVVRRDRDRRVEAGHVLVLALLAPLQGVGEVPVRHVLLRRPGLHVVLRHGLPPQSYWQTTSTSAGRRSLITISAARRTAACTASGSSIGPAPCQPSARAVAAKSGAGLSISIPMYARPASVPRWCAIRSWCSQSL